MTIFSRIINGEIPCYKVAETADFLAFLDIRPQAKGHTIVIPKKEVDYIFEVDDDTLAGLFVFAKKVARAVEKVVPCLRVGVAVIGLEVPHAHVHLIPLNSMNDMKFSGSARVELSPAEMSELAAEIVRNI